MERKRAWSLWRARLQKTKRWLTPGMMSWFPLVSSRDGNQMSFTKGLRSFFSRWVLRKDWGVFSQGSIFTELFARSWNCRLNWISVGDQLSYGTDLVWMSLFNLYAKETLEESGVRVSNPSFLSANIFLALLDQFATVKMKRRPVEMRWFFKFWQFCLERNNQWL